MAKKARNYEVGSVAKALEILGLFAAETPSLTVTDLNRRMGIPKSTAHNLLRTLQSFDFVNQDPGDRRFRLGPRVFELGRLYLHGTHLVEAVLPHLRSLADQTKETLKLAVLSRGDVLILTAIESPYQLHTRGDEGKRAPLHCTGLGKALLASLPDSRVREIVERRGLERFTRSTITSLARLERELSRIRERRYALDLEENEEGVRCVASCVQNVAGPAPVAISISGPASRITEERLNKFGALLAAEAAVVSAALGGQMARSPAPKARPMATKRSTGKQS